MGATFATVFAPYSLYRPCAACTFGQGAPLEATGSDPPSASVAAQGILGASSAES